MHKLKGFALFEVIAVLAVLGATVGITAVYLSKHQSDDQARVSSGKNTQLKEACEEQEGLKICLSADTQEVSASEKVSLTVTVKNFKTSDYNYTFSCTDTGPIYYINAKYNPSICGQALTPVTLKAGKTNTYHKSINGSDFKEGDNKIYTVWAAGKSGSITIKRKAAAAAELNSQFATCQKQASWHNLPGFCDSITIVIKERYKNYSCDDWKRLMKRINLSIPCADLMDTGIGIVYVPKLDHEKWVDKIKTLPEAESVK
jgi:type II secretory pathway pseudopilin PulG